LRWVVRYTGEFVRRWAPFETVVGRSRRADETITPFLRQDIHDLAVLIDGAPQLMNRSADPKEYLVDMPASAHPWSVPPRLKCRFSPGRKP
jgi:hypothetical protein